MTVVRFSSALLLAGALIVPVASVSSSVASPADEVDGVGGSHRSAPEGEHHPAPSDAGRRGPQEVQPVRIRTNPRINERYGAAGREKVSWSANSRARPDHYNVLMKDMNDGSVCRLNARGTEGESGGYAGDVGVFTQRRPGHPGDLQKAVWCERVGAFPRNVNTASNEFLPTMTRKWLLFTRYTARTGTHRVLLLHRPSGSLRELASSSGSAKVFSGQVRGEYATWYRVGTEHSDVFVYSIATKTAQKVPRPARFTRQYNPGMSSDGTVFYHRRTKARCGAGAQLVRNPIDAPPKVIHRYQRGFDGGRVYNIHPGRARPFLYFTVRDCAAPAHRATDIYGMWG